MPVITYDQPLYIKAIEICCHKKDLEKEIVLVLGQMHVRMSYIGAMSHLMANSGLEEILQLVYAPLTGIYLSLSLFVDVVS